MMQETRTIRRRLGMRSQALLSLVTVLGLAVAPSAYALGGEDKSGVSPSKLSLPKGPGSLGGVGENVEPNFNMGLMTYRVPIQVPQGYEGLTPDVALTYSSGGGNSDAGLGWSLNLPTIERMTVQGLPRYAPDDTFAANGSDELVRISENGEYRARFERGFVRYRWVDDAADGLNGYWTAEYPDGRVGYFGATAEGETVDDARTGGGGGTFRYHLVEVRDQWGHALRYHYDKASDDQIPLIQSIDYGGEEPRYRIEFKHEDRPDPVTDGKSGVLIHQPQRLGGVVVRVRGEQQRRYELTYEEIAESGGASRLAKVRWFGLNDEGPYPIQFSFDYSAGLGTSEPAIVQFESGVDVDLRGGTADLVDLNSDGLPDLIDTRDGVHRVFTNEYATSGSQRFSEPDEAKVGGLQLASVATEMFDLDGDGRSDMVDAETRLVLWNRGEGTWQREESLDDLELPNLADDANLRFLDYNNDKQTDFIHVDSSAIWVYENLGDGRFELVEGLEPIGAGFASDNLTVADMNGDGLQDLVRKASELVSYRANLGWGRWSTWLEMSGTPGNLETSSQLVDLNGDGLADLVTVLGDAVAYSINRDARMFEPRVLLQASTQVAIPEVESGTSVRFADMNGSGSTDVVWFDAGGQVTYLELFDTRPNLLTRIDNGIGKVITVSYGSSTDHLHNGGQSWTLRLPHPMLTVDEIAVLDELSGREQRTVVAYRNGFYDGREKQFRGFQDVVVTEPGDDYSDAGEQVLLFDVGLDDAYRKGLLLSEVSSGPSGPLRTNRNEYQDCSLADVPETSPGVRFVCPTRTTRIEQEGQPESDWVTVEETTQHDGYGNVTLKSSLGIVAVGGSGCEPCSDSRPGVPCGETCKGDERFKESVFISPQPGGPWILGKASQTFEYSSSDQKQERRYYYDGEPFVGGPLGQLARGALTRVGGRVSSADEHFIDLERHERDADGSVTATLDPDGRRREFTYDDDGLLVETEAITFTDPDAYSLELRVEYEPVLESIRQSSGWVYVGEAGESDEALTYYKYDAFGRIAAFVRPGDSSDMPTEEYLYELGAPVSRIVRRARSKSGEAADLEQVQCFDGLGRPLQTRTRVASDEFLVTGFEQYNARGKVFSQLSSYVDSVASCDREAVADVPMTFTWYDAQGRPVASRLPDDDVYPSPSTTRTEYLPLRQRAFDEEDTLQSGNEGSHANTPTATFTDGLGRTIAVERMPTPDEALRTDFFYDGVTGELAGYRDADGNRKTQVYDWLGRVVRVNDPDSGTTRFTYDGANNVIAKTDATNTTVLATYDGAGRRVAQWEADRRDETLIEFIHDAVDDCDKCTFAAGNLARVIYPLDDKGKELGVDEFGHDSRDQPTFLARQLGGKRFEFQTDYDNAGRIRAAKYPADLALDFDHDGAGRLTRAGSYVPEVIYDASGRVAAMWLGNGAVTSYGYDARDRLTSIDSANVDGLKIQSTRFEHDRVGNILVVKDDAVDKKQPSVNAKYTYDSLYRLVEATLDPGRAKEETVAFTYDDVDNLKRKVSSWGAKSPDHVGDYTYLGDAGPHLIGSAGEREFKHDAAGRLTQHNGQSLTWDYVGRLQSSDERLKVSYGPAHERVRKVENGETSYFLTPDFELRDGSAILYVRVGDARVVKIEAPQAAAEFLPDLAPAELDGDKATPEPDGLFTAGDAWLAHAGSEQFLELPGEVDEKAVPQLLAASTRRMLGGLKADQLKVTYLHHDHLGTVVAVTDENGKLIERRAQYPFGLDRSVSVSRELNYSFTDKEIDPSTGLMYAGARYMDPFSGTWTAPDPAFALLRDEGLAANIAEYQNRYNYVSNNPVAWQDPDGEFMHILAGAGIGAVVGGVMYAVTAKEFSGRALAAAMAGGAVTGGIAAATGGGSLLVQAAGATVGSVAGGAITRGIATGKVSEALDGKAMAMDAVVGAAGFGVGKAIGAASKAVLGKAKGTFSSGSKSTCVLCFAPDTDVRLDGATAAISKVELGTLAAQENADCSLLPREGWRRFRLLLFDPDGGTEVEADLLRPAEWGPEQSLEVGSVVELGFDDIRGEVFAEGKAKVLYIEDAPPLESGEGCPVTGKFRHVEHDLLKLRLDGDNHELLVTRGHPLFSEDAGGWVRAGQLSIGETLRTADGIIRIVDVERVPGETEVFNLEVAVGHSFYVGDDGVWAHNCGGKTSVYRAAGAGGTTKYVGITDNFKQRAAAHLRQKGISIDKIPGLSDLSRADARAVEQVLIESHGLGKSGGTLINKINSIAKDNPAYGDALKRGVELLKGAGVKGF